MLSQFRSQKALITLVFLFLVLTSLTACKKTPPTPATTTQAPIVQTVRVDDVDIAYKIMGKGQPLVMVMGYASPMDGWAPKLLEELAQHYQLIIFDNRGVGLSSASDKELTLELMAQDTIGLMDKLGIRKANLLGWSMGSIIAQELAINHGDRFGKVVLYSTDYNTVDVLKAINKNMAVPDPDPLAYLIPKTWRAYHADPKAYMPNVQETVSEEIIQRQHKAITKWQGSYDRLPNIKNHTLFIIGTNDEIVLAHKSLEAAARVPGAWVNQFQNTGHGLMYQIPTTMANAVLFFLKTPQLAK